MTTKTNFRVKQILFGIFLLFHISIYGQNALVPDILPSANATALGKYGQFPVSYYTGQANISIPLYTLQTNGVSVPFSLDYSGSGILVNNHTGWVGQNWTLNGGGVITRSVNGQADELGHFNGDSLYNNRRSLFSVINYDNYLTEEATDTYDELKIFALNKLTPGFQYRDSEPDIYHFNFNGVSGRFFYGDDATWKVVSDQNLKIEFVTTDPNNFQDAFIPLIPHTPGKKFEKVIKGFKIIDDTGNVYTFGYDPNAIEYSLPFFQHYADCYLELHYPNWIANAWYLTKIEDFNGNLLFKFNYSREFFTGQLYQSRDANQNFCKLTNEDWINSSSNAGTNIAGSLTSPVYLRGVKCLNGDSLGFNIVNAIEQKMNWTTEMIVRYQELQMKTCDSPPLPFLQEEGYYSFSPTGAMTNPLEGLMWKKLTGISVQQNDNQVKSLLLYYNNNINERLKLERLEIRANSLDPMAYNYVFDYHNFDQLPEMPTKKIDHFGYYDGTDYYQSPTFSIPDENNNHYNSRQSNITYATIGMLKSITYPTGGRTEFDFELLNYGNELSTDKQTLISSSGSIGGLRIKEIRNYDIGGSSPVTSKSYYYRDNYPNGLSSSGILALKPRYVWFDWLSPTDFWPDGGYSQNIFSTNILVPLGNIFESHVGYKEVAEVNLNGSYTVYKFTSHADFKDEMPYGNFGLDFSTYDKFTDRSYMRGKLTEKIEYNIDNTMARREKNFYRTDLNPSNSDPNYGITCEAAFGNSCIASSYDKYYKGNARKLYHSKFYLDSTSTEYLYGANTIKTTNKNQYVTQNYFGNPYVFMSERSIVNSDGKVFKDNYKYPFNHTSSYLGQNSYMSSLVSDHRFPVVFTEKKVNNSLVAGNQDLYENYTGVLLPKYKLGYEATWNNGVLSGLWDTMQQINNYNLVFLRPISVLNKGWQPESIILNTRGKPTSWQYISHNRSYLYNVYDFVETFIDIDGQQKTFEYDSYGRLKKSTILPKNVTTDYNYYYGTSLSDLSYFKTKTKYPLTANSGIDSLVNLIYVDGLGRSIQNVNKYGAPDGTSDVISKTEYDNQGRQYRSYEPISVGNNNGNYYAGTFSGGFSQQLYQTNPLDRPYQTTPPAWQTTNHSYGTNTTTLTNSEGLVYGVNSLMLTTVTDPDGKHTDTYTDKLGRTVLQRKRQNVNVVDTWTVYDDKNRPVKVFPPGSSTSTSELIYEYRYDGDNNMIYKKVPDASAEEYRFDSRNLEVAKRNSVLLAQNKWLVTHYDLYGRPSKRGYFNGNNPTPATMPTIHTLLEEYFYDGFNGSTTNTAPIYKGKLKKSRFKVLNDLATNAFWTETEYFYDDYGRVSSESIINHLGGSETNTFTYDFADNVMSSTHLISGANGVNHVNTHTYDHRGRKIFDRHNFNSTGEVTTSQCVYDHKSQIVERNLGRHATSGTHQYLQSLDYTYNPQGWLTDINTLYTDLLPFTSDPCIGDIQSYVEPPLPITTDEQDLFALDIDFNTTLSGTGIPASQNGNITALKWWHRNSGYYNQSYTYRYDFLNRVTEAKHGEIIQGVHNLKNQYNEKLEYDPRGNIMKLNRKGMVQRPDLNEQCYRPMTIDSLTYVYQGGTNKLVQVIDNAPCMDTITLPAVIDRDVNYSAGKLIRIESTDVLCNVNMNLTAGTEIRIIDTLHLPNSCGTPALVIAYQGPCPQNKYTEGFNQQSISGQYTYDTGGNMTFDPNKKLTFHYNHLNLPYRIMGAENDELQMLYDANGTLLQRKFVKNNTEISKIDYLRGKELKNGLMESVYFSDGRILKDGTSWKYEYNIKDHLGNIRVTFSDDNNNGLIAGAEIRSRNDYYAFGMEWDNYLQQSEFKNPKNRYKYNGKEMVEEMGVNLLDYHARQMDPVLGRFISVDILSSEFPGWSGYGYVHNNPILLIDPTGMSADSTRIYNTNAQYQYTINDNLPNEDHFLSQNKINDLNSQCCNDINQEGEFARSISNFYIGSDTRGQLQSITSVSNRLGKEQGFVLTIGSDRQLDVTNISKFADVTGSQVQDMNLAIQNSGISGIVGVGHTHPNGKNESPSPFPSPAYVFGNRLSDYSPHMHNPTNNRVYGGYLSIVSARNGFTIYTNAVVPNSWTFTPAKFSQNKAILQSFKGNRF
jgi:RHS repeat-associated protein